MENILFLDMDGVLCTPRVSMLRKTNNSGFRVLDAVACEWILRIVSDYNFRIVVTSAWRGDNGFREMMGTHGIAMHNFHRDWRTGQKNTRGEEIEQWLIDNPDVENNYIIFEDEDFDLTHDQKEKHLVKCDLHNGIVFESILQFHDRIEQLGLENGKA